MPTPSVQSQLIRFSDEGGLRALGAASGTLNGSEQNQGQQRAAITSRSGSDQSSSVTMTFSAAPRGSTWSKARSASEKGDAVADHLGEAFPVLGKCPRDLRGQ